HEAFTVRVPSSEPLEEVGDRTVALRPGDIQQITEKHRPLVSWPDDKELEIDKSNPDYWVYQFPAKCTIRHEAVDRFSLAWVIALAVAAICLWGTLVGSMLPMVFMTMGVDPGIASSPFVATFVDVTGIMIYFTIAKMWFNL